MIFMRHEKLKEYIRLYPVTSILLVLNLAVFVLMLAAGKGHFENRVFLRFGALSNASPYDHQVWRLFASMFVHFSFQHILFNAFAIYVFAPPLERILGAIRYALLYLIGGLIGNLLSLYMLQDNPKIIAGGASGAIFAVYGAYLFICLLKKRGFDESSRKIALIVLAVALVYSFLDRNVDIWAHIGGLIGGFLLYPALDYGRMRK